jgi:hypothetical protein
MGKLWDLSGGLNLDICQRYGGLCWSLVYVYVTSTLVCNLALERWFRRCTWAEEATKNATFLFCS